jgi:general secretion pathway protein B
MSYILDALKKSEKERKRGHVPDLMTIQDMHPPKQKRRIVWFVLIVTVMIINGAVLLWVEPWKTKQAGTISQKASDQLVVANTDDALPGKTISKLETENQAKESEQKPLNTAMADNKKQMVQESKQVNPENGEKKRMKDKTVAQPEQVKKNQDIMIVAQRKEPVVPEQPETQPEKNDLPVPVPDKIYVLAELPPSIQQKLPDFTVTTFFYSEEPGSRMARINGQVIREGQYLAAGLKLEQILETGFIFSYQNFRFQVGLK